MSRGSFPCPTIIDPSVATDHRSRSMLALEFGIVSEGVMRYGSVWPETDYFHVTDIAALPLAGFVLKVFYELIPRLPGTPAISCDEAFRQVLLRP